VPDVRLLLMQLLCVHTTMKQVVFNDLCAEDAAGSVSATSGASHQCVTVASSALSEWEHVRSQVARKAVSEQDVAAAIKVQAML
jgi:hypothetical protein